MNLDEATKMLLDVAKGYEKWEADLVMNADWTDGIPVMTQTQFDQLIELQTKRNAAIKAAGEQR